MDKIDIDEVVYAVGISLVVVRADGTIANVPIASVGMELTLRQYFAAQADEAKREQSYRWN